MNRGVSSAIIVVGLVLTLGGAASWGDTKPTINDFSDANRNTAGGTGALQSNTTGSDNTAFGAYALFSNTTGRRNTASGVFALYRNTSGGNNTASGYNALSRNTTGSDNTASGVEALLRNTSGAYNTALGFRALYNNTGSRNLALGLNAGFNLTSGTYNIYLGHTGFATESNTMRLGQVSSQTRTFIAGIVGVPVSGSTVVIDGNGQLGTVASSVGYKRDIAAMGARSKGLHQLRPVTFRYKQDPQGQRQYGLIAEEVAKVYPELVVRGSDGKVEAVQYHELIPMLLNEVQHQQQKLEAQSRELAELQAQNARLQNTLGQRDEEQRAQNAAMAARLEQLEASAVHAATLATR